MASTGEGKDGWGASAGKWLESRIETIATLLVGLAAAFLGFFHVLTGDDLSSAILAVLVVFAGALLIDRERRIRQGERLDNVEALVRRTGDAVRVLASSKPYHVVLSENSWDIAGNGNASGRRLKRLRFSQDEVVAIIDQHRAEGQPTKINYFAGDTEIQSMHEFPFRGRACNLVVLDRVYMRDEEQDFILEREGTGIFPRNPDRSWVAVREPTSLVRLIIRWADRAPTAVRLVRESPDGTTKVAGLTPKTLDDGRTEARTDVPEPDIGERIGIEWNW